jgi:hypothetical protein
VRPILWSLLVTRPALAVLALLTALTACAGSDQAAPGERQTAKATTSSSAPDPSTESAAPTTASDARCEEVSPELRETIGQGAQPAFPGLEITEAVAVRSQQYSKVYMVAGRIVTKDDEQIGLWATNSLSPDQGVLLSVDGYAAHFTIWPKAADTEADIRLGDEGTFEAIACLTGESAR